MARPAGRRTTDHGTGVGQKSWPRDTGFERLLLDAAHRVGMFTGYVGMSLLEDLFCYNSVCP